MAKNLGENAWGPPSGIDSQDYQVLVQKGSEKLISRPVSQVGHTLTSPNQETQDALTFNSVKLKNGKIVPIRITKRGSRELGRSFTIGFTAMRTELYRLAKSGKRANVYIEYIGADGDEQYDHGYVMVDSVLNEPAPSGDMITVDGEPAIITETTELSVDQWELLWKLRSDKVYTNTGVAAYVVAFDMDSQRNELYEAGRELLIGGGDGTAAPDLAYSDDRFSAGTITTVSTGGTDTHLVVAALSKKGLLVFSEVLDVDPAAVSNVGRLAYTTDKNTVAASTTPADQYYYALLELDNLILAGGTDGTDAKIAMSSDNGVNFMDVASSNIPSAEHIIAGAVDEEAGFAYFITAASLLRVRRSGSSLEVVDLSANLVGSPTLASIAVLGENHIIVGGASGYVADSEDGGATFTQQSLSTSSSVDAIAGTKWRTVLGAGSDIHIRDFMTSYVFQKAVFAPGTSVSGNVTDIKNAPDGNPNVFAVVTDAGELVISKPYYPDA